MNNDKKIIKYFFLAALILAAVGFFITYEGPKSKPPEDKQALPPEQLASIAKAVEDEKNTAILENNMINTQPKFDPTKLNIEDMKIGGGDEVKAGDKVYVHYSGWLTDGAKFDSSYDRGVPFGFTVGQGQVIAGWEQGLLGMKVGGKRKLIIPAAWGYGASGVPGVIPPNAILIFEIELIKINNY